MEINFIRSNVYLKQFDRNRARTVCMMWIYCITSFLSQKSTLDNQIPVACRIFVNEYPHSIIIWHLFCRYKLKLLDADLSFKMQTTSEAAALWYFNASNQL